MHIRDLRRIRPMLTFKTASTIATSIIHSKLDYCNSLFCNIDDKEIKRLQSIQNALARAVTRTPKFHHITPVLKSLHWLKIPQRIQYKILSLTYNSIQSSKPFSLYQLIRFQPPRSTRSSSYVTLLPADVDSRIKFTNRAFSYAAPHLWNKLPVDIRKPAAPSPTLSSNPDPPPPRLQISPAAFHARIKQELFKLSYPDDDSIHRPAYHPHNPTSNKLTHQSANHPHHRTSKQTSHHVAHTTLQPTTDTRHPSTIDTHTHHPPRPPQ
jgi:hypothetical protein